MYIHANLTWKTGSFVSRDRGSPGLHNKARGVKISPTAGVRADRSDNCRLRGMASALGETLRCMAFALSQTTTLAPPASSTISAGRLSPGPRGPSCLGCATSSPRHVLFSGQTLQRPFLTHHTRRLLC